MSVYRAKLTAQLREAFPLPAILEMILEYLVETGKKNYHAFAAGPFQIPEFDFLYNQQKVASTTLKWTEKIATIDHNISISSNISAKMMPPLLALTTPSLVGKNDKTILDPTVRKSSEIVGDRLQLDGDFLSMISQEIQALAIKLGHPTRVIAKLHKLVIYQQGDFFNTHIDSPHDNAEPMIFTAVVAFHMAGVWPRGGELQVGDHNVGGMPRSQQLRLTLFYHDEPHSVLKLESGFRASLIFDVLDTGAPIFKDSRVMDDASSAFWKVCATSTQTFAFFFSFV